MIRKSITFAFLLFTFHFSFSTLAQTVVQLWPEGKIPNSLNNTTIQEKTEVGKDGIVRISNVTVPSYSIYKPAKPNGVAVVICPGGGYWIEAASHEGTEIAQWFNSFGVTAFVLKYRLPDEKLWSKKEEVAFQDAMQAIKLVRQNAKEYGINPSKIGIMGFSAGGHLASTVSTHWFRTLSADAIGTDAEKAIKPNFSILMYPVISSGDVRHAGSFDKLLGKTPSAEMLEYYSTDKQVSAKTPPTLLVHATDDTAVPVENSLLYLTALKKNKISASLLVYENGGHGFGLATKQKGSVKNWPQHAQQWLEINVLNK